MWFALGYCSLWRAQMDTLVHCHLAGSHHINLFHGNNSGIDSSGHGEIIILVKIRTFERSTVSRNSRICLHQCNSNPGGGGGSGNNCGQPLQLQSNFWFGEGRVTVVKNLKLTNCTPNSEVWLHRQNCGTLGSLCRGKISVRSTGWPLVIITNKIFNVVLAQKLLHS